MTARDPDRGLCRPWKLQKENQPERARAAFQDPTPEEVFLRRPTRPLPLPNPMRKHVQEACLGSGSPGRKHQVTSSGPPIQKVEGSTRPPSGLHGGQKVLASRTPQAAGTRLVQNATHSVPSTNSKPRSVSSTHGPGHIFKPQAPAKFPAGNSTSIPRPSAQSVCRNSNLSIEATGKRAAPTSIQPCQKARKKPRLSAQLSPRKTTQTANPQPQEESHLAKILQPCKEPQLPPDPQSPNQHIRMIFKRLNKGQWSCRLVPDPSPTPAEKPTLCCPEPSNLGEERGTPSQVPLSVLEEDLQLSSSSEESDGQ